jgi:phage protein|nr:MAG TPA: tail assembly chaperone protein [Caudoviricetes sp.]
MDALKGFFKENAKAKENEKIAVSDRFVGEDGKPLMWEIKAISNDEDDKLREESTTQEKVKKRVYVPKFNYSVYLKKLITACVVFPNLKNEELQNSYGVMGEEALISAMLLPGEFNALAEAIQEICGFDKDVLEEKIEEAKN